MEPEALMSLSYRQFQLERGLPALEARVQRLEASGARPGRAACRLPRPCWVCPAGARAGGPRGGCAGVAARCPPPGPALLQPLRCATLCRAVSRCATLCPALQAERDAIQVHQEDKVKEFLALRCELACLGLLACDLLVHIWASSLSVRNGAGDTEQGPNSGWCRG